MSGIRLISPRLGMTKEGRIVRHTKAESYVDEMTKRGNTPR
jgi:hypothetical protein